MKAILFLLLPCNSLTPLLILVAVQIGPLAEQSKVWLQDNQMDGFLAGQKLQLDRILASLQSDYPHGCCRKISVTFSSEPDLI